MTHILIMHLPCNSWIIGKVDSLLSDPEIYGDTLVPVKNPRLLKYENHEALNGTTAKFQHFDSVVKNESIYTKVNTYYKADENLAELYQDHLNEKTSR